MSVDLITATIGCDGCGKQFKVEIGNTWRVGRHFKTMFDVALDAVRAGFIRSGSEGCCSVQADNRTLCGPCTTVADNEWIAEHPSFISGIQAVEGLEMHWDVETYDGTTARLIGRKPEFDSDLNAYGLPLSEAEALDRRADQIAARPLAVAHG